MKTACLLVVPALVTTIAAGDATAAAGLPGPATAASTYTLITEPDQSYTPIYDFINSATKTLDMTMYELTDTTAEQDLGAVASRGVKVRVILDQNLEKSRNTTAFDYLSQHGVSVVWANPTYAATHQKTITVDGNTSTILTGNLTSQYYSTSRDFAVMDNNPSDVAAIEQVFNADFTGASITPTDGADLVWSPTDSQTQILNVINSATTTLQVENEEMAYATVVTALENAAARGVTVQVTMTNTSNEYSSQFDALTAAGVQVATYASSASLYIHAKAIVADYGTANARVYLGSENFSNASLNKNRELGLITTDPTIMSSVHKTLASDYDNGTAWSS